MFYYGRTYTATVEGSALKFQHCEACGQEYVYQVYRQARGSGHAPFGIGGDDASERAAVGAHAAIGRALDKAIDAVKCAHCGHVQARMVQKERVHRAIRTFCAGMLLTLPVALVVRFQNLDDSGPALMGIAFAVGTVLSLGLSALWWVIWDPNAGRMPIWGVKREILEGGITRQAYEQMLEEARQQEQAQQPPPNPPPQAYGAPPPGYPPPQSGGMNTAEKAPWER